MPKEVLFNEAMVLQKATGLFWHKGYNGTSMDDLTKATGLSRSSLYNSFGDKHSLFMRCLNYYLSDQEKSLMQAVGGTASPLKKIKIAFKYMVDVILRDEKRDGCLMINTTTELCNVDEEIGTLVLKNTDAMEHLFQQWVKEAQQQGEIGKTFSAQAIGKHLLNTYSGLRISGQAKPDKKSLDDIVKVALSVLV
ncbi:TetR/AcrR family transcriptional regulator [Chitinophaga pinensis]|uniref:TetR/AcrR family transcriptional regulator n=1 Tax=Chitinophaga pinensis TaxID=79329 RepID=A0A5C6LM14_9BACT|nr:TetR/AcrR family transcriptional regulator [Chitinophaga pinensis]TWV93282.1 TetR/AcrR family transcriptional regulator [Chitinophaga pinensis]